MIENVTEEAPLLHSGTKFVEVAEPRRWFILIAFSVYSAITAIQWLTFNATPAPTMAYFEIDETQLLYFTDAGQYASIILSFPACWIAFKYFKASILVSCLVISASTWARHFAATNYLIVLLCQIAMGIITTPFFAFATLIPDRWFPQNERFWVTTIAVYANYIGSALALVIPCWLLNGDPSNMPENTFVSAIICSVPLILVLAFVQDRPKLPPSYSALVKREDKRSFMEEIIDLFKTPGFIACSICFGITFGLANCISTTNAIYMQSLKLTDLDQGYISAFFLLSGMISGSIGSFVIEKKGLKNYDFIIKVFYTLTAVTLGILGLVFLKLENPSLVIIYACNGLLGIGLIGITPFTISSIIETAFPAQESMSTNVAPLLGSLVGVIGSHLSTASFVGKGGYLLLAALYLPCWFYIMFFFKTDYRKQKADDAHQEISREIIKETSLQPNPLGLIPSESTLH